MKRSVDGTVCRAAARLEEEAPQFRSAAVHQVARPPSLAQRGGIGGVGLDRVPGDYVGAASAAVRPSPFEEPKDDIRKLLAAETQADSKPTTAAAGAAAVPSAESNWAIDGGSTSLRSIPTYYPLEKSSRCVSLGGRGVEAIAARISDCCRIMSVHAEYEGGGDVPVSSDWYLESNIKV